MQINNTKNDEQKSITMYRDYGIAEWHEKSLVLTNLERQEIENNIEDGKLTPLVQLAKLPFPKFVEAYFRRFQIKKYEEYVDDPAFGYKMYLLKDNTIRMLSEAIRNPELNIEDLERKYDKKLDYIDISEVMKNPLDCAFTHSKPTQRRCPDRQMKFLYLTQYIDYEEAIRLNLNIAPTFQRDRSLGIEENGFEMERKLDTLNTPVKLILSRIIGLYGFRRYSITEICKQFGFNTNRVNYFYDELVPLLLRTLGEFKNKTGYIEKEYAPDETKEYTNRKYRYTDLETIIKFIYKNVLSDNERLILSGKSNKEMNLYIAYKYIYVKDLKKCLENLLIDGSPQDYEKTISTL